MPSDSLQQNQYLYNIAGFAGLTHVLGDLEIAYCSALTNISGFNSLTQIDGTFSIIQVCVQ